MKTLLIATILLTSACSLIPETTYVKVGAGYKLNETKFNMKQDDGSFKQFDDPISAHIEIGAECVWENVTCGARHRSQWFTGYPFNGENEYGVNEVFIEYKFELGELLK